MTEQGSGDVELVGCAAMLSEPKVNHGLLGNYAIIDALIMVVNDEIIVSGWWRAAMLSEPKTT